MSKEKSKQNILDLDLLSFVSHELKTPLSTLRINTERLKSSSSQETKKMAERMSMEIEWMIQFISDILDFKKAENKIPLSLNLCKWNEWLKSIQPNIENKLNAFGVKLKLIPLEQEREISIAPVYLQQAVFNLLINAAEYSPPGGVITLQSKIKEPTLHIQVGDEGPGIPAEEKDKIFESFYTKRDKCRQIVKGKGLGLFIVKKIIEAHGGQVYAENRSHKQGALFGFTLACL